MTDSLQLAAQADGDLTIVSDADVRAWMPVMAAKQTAQAEHPQHEQQPHRGRV